MILCYDRGTLLLRGVKPGAKIPEFFKFDPRVKAYRALAYKYWEAVKRLEGVEDKVLQPVQCRWSLKRELSLRPYQREALESWLSAGMRGVVVLPTGAGKTRVALAAMWELKAPTLIVVPTLELMDQWERAVSRFFQVPIGRFGGGSKEVRCVTVATYDSAYINAEVLGNKFLLVVFDEVHHLPSPGYRQIAELNAAPFRLGLTATPEREDEGHLLLPELVGPIVYRKKVGELKGRYLADFDVVVVRVKLSEEERERYLKLVKEYKSYLEERGIRLRSPRDFEKLVKMTGLDRRAREALLAWREARRIAFNARAKLEKLREILEKHRGDRVLIFTENTEMVREISRRLLIPEITYKTPERERREVLKAFREGRVSAVVTSRVLEEGVDVPEANVAVVISGTGSRREFVQRLGRILRPRPGKRAVLYELVTSGTKEVGVARRRKRGL